MNYFADHANKEHSIVGIHASWLDHLHLPAEFLTAKTQMLNRIHYSPALQSAGVCAVIITTLWLISAYFNEAFSYENTIYDSERVVLDTGKSWLYTGAGMIAIALASDSTLCGCPIQNHSLQTSRNRNRQKLAHHQLRRQDRRRKRVRG